MARSQRGKAAAWVPAARGCVRVVRWQCGEEAAWGSGSVGWRQRGEAAPTVVVELDHVEGLARRLLAHVLVHLGRAVLVQRQRVRQRLGRRLQAERHVCVADTVPASTTDRSSCSRTRYAQPSTPTPSSGCSRTRHAQPSTPTPSSGCSRTRHAQPSTTTSSSRCSRTRSRLHRRRVAGVHAVVR